MFYVCFILIKAEIFLFRSRSSMTLCMSDYCEFKTWHADREREGALYLLEKQGGKNADETDAVKNELAYHFYVSRVPCGDATIRPMSDEIEYVCRNKKRKLDTGNTDKTLKPGTIESGDNDDWETRGVSMKETINETIHDKISETINEKDTETPPEQKYRTTHEVSDERVSSTFVSIHRTGARPANKSITVNANHETTGILRLKPGRNDHFSSHSHCCSDKLAKWCILGWQGSLLHQFIKTSLYFDTITIHSADNIPATLNSSKRAILRFHEKIGNLKNKPLIKVIDCGSSVKIKSPWLDSIEISRESEADSVVWYQGLIKPEKYTRGYLAGCSKKVKGKPKSGGKVSRYWMKKVFVERIGDDLGVCLDEVGYDFVKKGARQYNIEKIELKTEFGWNHEHGSKFDGF